MQHAPREYDALDPALLRQRVVVRRASESDLEAFYPQIGKTLSIEYASLDWIERMRQRNPDHLWSVHSMKDDRQIGFYFMLMLTADGLKALKNGVFDPIHPSLDHVAGPNEEMAAIYKWGVFVKGIAAGAIPILSSYLRTSRFAHLDLYANASTDKGREIMEHLGFQRLGTTDSVPLYWYQRLVNRSSFSPLVHNSETKTLRRL